MGRKFLILLFLPLLVGCNFYRPIKENFYVPPIEVTTHNYYEVQDHTILWTKIFQVGLPNYYVYCYSPTCSHCSDLKDWIIEKALERQDIYFVKASEYDVIVKDTSSTIGATNVSQLAILGYPSLIQITNQIVVQNVAGKTKIQNLLN